MSLVWCPGPDDLSQDASTYPYYDVTHKKAKTPTFPIFEKVWTTRFPASLEGLNSSLTQLSGMSYDHAKFSKKVVCVGLKGLRMNKKRV